MEFRAKPPLQAGNARVLVPSDLFFLQQRPASPTIAGTRASGPSIIATSPEKAPQMDEEASRCFICCKCSVCMSVVVCVYVAYHVPRMRLCSVGDLFPGIVSQIRSHFTTQAQSYYSFPLCPFTCLLCQYCLKGIDCFRRPSYGEPPEIAPDFSLSLTCLD